MLVYYNTCHKPPSEIFSRLTYIYVLNYWQLMSEKFDHAGNIEYVITTSHCSDLVQMQKAKPNSKELQKSKMAYTAIANSPGSFPRLTGNGVWGDPTGARVKKGSNYCEKLSIILNLS